MALSFNVDSISGLISTSLTSALQNLTRSTLRLSTGLRINTASDDPAGLAMYEMMRAQEATYSQARNNAQDAQSLIQTAESAMNVIDEKLIRMKELAEQASTGTYTSSQRLILHSEFQLMASEIDRIAGSTTFNGMKLLDGSLESSSTYTTSGGWTEPNDGVLVHVGDGNVRAEDYYYISVKDVRTQSLFSNPNIAISTQTAAATALEIINTAIINKDNAMAWLGAMQNRLEGSIDNLDSQINTLSAAESDIIDVDFAEELTSYVGSLILMQSGIAMMAQANALPSMALTLIEAL